VQPDYRVIACVTKTHGRKGEVVAVPADGLPLLMREGLRVCVVPPLLKGDRWHEVLDVDDGPHGQLVALSGVTDQGAASKIVGRSLLASVADLPEDLTLHDGARLVGRDVVDSRLGAIGHVEEVMFGTAQDVWVVRGGDLGEVLVPAVDAIVTSVPADGPIQVTLPPGLLDPAGMGE
jgi:16S rRNA processing protein RimM